MRIVCINLDRVPDRAAFMADQVGRLGLTDAYRLLSATDARSAPPSPRYRPHRWGPRWEMSASEVACFESHRRAWQICRDEGHGALVVMEDDVILSDRFGEALGAVQEAVRGCDVVKLDGVPQDVRYGPATALGSTGFALRPLLQSAASAACYAISARGAERLLAASQRYCDHLDDFVFCPDAAWRVAQIEPAVAVQAVWSAAFAGPEDVAQSERTRDAGINRDKRKGPVAYRAVKEARRNLRRLRWRLWADRRLRAQGGRIGPVPLAADLGGYA